VKILKRHIASMGIRSAKEANTTKNAGGVLALPVADFLTKKPNANNEHNQKRPSTEGRFACG
jgi:hypothetical protein